MPWIVIADHLNSSLRIRRSEWLLAWVMALIGYTLLLPAHTFQTSRSWDIFAEWFDEPTWGVILIVIGGLRVVALFINGAARATPHARAVGAFLASGVWFALALGFNLSPVSGVISPAIYTPFFICDFWNFLTAALEAGRTDTKHKRGQPRGTSR